MRTLLVELVTLKALWHVGPLLDPLNPLDAAIGALRLIGMIGVIVCTVATVAALPDRLAGRLGRRAIAVVVASGATAVPALAAPPMVLTEVSGIPVPPGAVVGSVATDDLVTPRASTVVRKGDSLWSISERHLRSLGPGVSSRRVAVYWARVVAANRHSLRSGNPDLIYPGETVLLPAP